MRPGGGSVRRHLAVLSVCAALALSFSFAVAQGWEIEQVDTAGWSSIQVELDTGQTVHLAYSSASEPLRIVHTYRDSCWHPEELSGIRPSAWSFAAGRHGELGLAYKTLDSAVNLRLAKYAERTQSGWASESVSSDRISYASNFHLAYDTSGAPGMVLELRDTHIRYVGRTDSRWRIQDIDLADGSHNRVDNPVGIQYDGQNRAYVVWYYAWIYHAYSQSLRYGVRDSTGRWQVQDFFWWNYFPNGHEPYAFDLYPGGGVAPVFYHPETFIMCCSTWVEYCRPGSARVKVDSLRREHIVYPIDSILRYAYRSGARWAFDTVVPLPVQSYDLELSRDGWLYVAFVFQGAPWLAKRRLPPLVGLQEQDEAVQVSTLALTSVCSGVIVIPGPQASVLVDVMGRKVMDLHPGPSNVRRLSPGVYFTRTADGEGPAAVRKVIVVK